MNILFLASWFPNFKDPVNGIFIKRHAKAIANKHIVHVVFAKRNDQIKGNIKIEKEEEKHYRALIYYYKGSNLPIFGRIVNLFRYIKAMKSACNEMMQKCKPDLIHLNVVFPAGLILLFSRKLRYIPLLITEHWSGYLNEDGSFQRNKFISFTSKIIFKRASLVTVVSEKNKTAMLNKKLHKDIRLISNLVDSCFSYTNKEDSEILHFLHVSSLVEREKNIKNMLAAFASFAKNKPLSRLTMIGGETNYKEYENDIKKLIQQGVDIQYLGNQSPDIVAQHMQQCDALLLPSNYEGQPVVVLEALCSGLPVLATPVGGIPECLDESNAILINASSKEAIIDALQTFYDQVKSFNRKAIAEKAHQLYTSNAIAAQFEIYYQDAIRKSSERL
jgi:glycosyltransferase involved in cell wall biosynthesis